MKLPLRRKKHPALAQEGREKSIAWGHEPGAISAAPEGFS